MSESGELSDQDDQQNENQNDNSHGIKRKKRNSATSSSSSSSSGSSSSTSSSSESEETSLSENECTSKSIKKRKLTHATNSKKVFIHEYLMNKWQIPNIKRLVMEIKQKHAKVQEELIGKFVSGDYAKMPINFKIEDVTRASAKVQKAFLPGPSVNEYFCVKNNIELKHPELPCLVQSGGGKHKSFYPMELMYFTQ